MSRANHKLILDPAPLQCVFRDCLTRQYTLPHDDIYYEAIEQSEMAVRGAIAAVMALTGYTPKEAQVLIGKFMNRDMDVVEVDDWVQEFGYLLEDYRKENK